MAPTSTYCDVRDGAWLPERMLQTLFCGVSEVGQSTAVPIAAEVGTTTQAVSGDVAEQLPRASLYAGIGAGAVPVASVALLGVTLGIPVLLLGGDFLFNDGRATGAIVRTIGKLL